MPEVTDQQLRDAGFTPDARNHPRDELSLIMLCAFVGVDPKLAPPAWWFFANDANAKAWDRVAKAARAYIEADQ